MSSYSDWLTTNRTLLTAAVTEAYNNRNAGNNLALAWTAMSNDGTVQGMLPTGSNKFYGGSPTATETDITVLQTWLTANPTHAGYLNLSPAANPSNNNALKAIGGGGNVGTEKRQWKGQPLYTFGNGILVGKNNKLVAAIGSEGGTDLAGFGTDTLTYFDGVPFSKGTNIAGTTVFAGDMVVSGSLQGSGGVIIIDDVIQLERGVNNPAGIGVDNNGKILLRHRGDGFLDLVAEDERIKNVAIDTSKNWVGLQNRNAARYGTSLIPNSSFEIKQTSGTTAAGNYAERPAGVVSIGTATSDITYPEAGVVSFNGQAKGILFPAVAIEGSKFAIRARYAGSAATTPSTNGTDEGLFLAMYETSDDNLAGKQYVYQTGSGANPSVTIETGIPAHASNVTIKLLNTSADGSGLDGSPVPISSGTWAQSTFTYEPTAGTNFASFGIFGKNLSGNTIYLDFVVMTPVTVDLSAVTAEVNTAVAAIDKETSDSIVADAQMKATSVSNSGNKLWAPWNSSTLQYGLSGDGDSTDKAVGFTTAAGVAGGIISSKIDCQNDTYAIGYRLKAINNPVTVRLKVIENPTVTHSGMVDNTTPLDPTDSGAGYATKNITITRLDSNNDPMSGAANTGTTIVLAANTWTTIMGTYQAGNSASISSSSGSSAAITRPSEFSIWLQADTVNAVVAVDYVYAKPQTASLNIAQTLATAAYADSQGFVTEINDLLVKESGSLITNCSMALASSNNVPSGYRSSGNSVVLSREDTSGDKSIRVVASSGTRTLVTPTFKMDTADKYSIGITAKHHGSSSTNVEIKIAYMNGDLEAGKVTIAPPAYSNLASDVQKTYTVGGVTADIQLTSALVIDPGGTEGGSTTTDWNLGTSYENILVTWSKPTGTWTTAAVIIEGSDDFEVDYVLVKEQVVSYALADEQAVARKEEAESSRRQAADKGQFGTLPVTNGFMDLEGEIKSGDVYNKHIKPAGWQVDGTGYLDTISFDANNDGALCSWGGIGTHGTQKRSSGTDTVYYVASQAIKKSALKYSISFRVKSNGSVTQKFAPAVFISTSADLGSSLHVTHIGNNNTENGAAFYLKNQSSTYDAAAIDEPLTNSYQLFTYEFTPAGSVNWFSVGFRHDGATTNPIFVDSILCSADISKAGVGLGNVVDLSPTGLTTNAAFTGGTFRDGIHTHFKDNDSDWSTRGTNITNQGTYQDNISTRLSSQKDRKKDDSKGQMGVFTNGRMTIKEDVGTWSKLNTTISLKPAGWETYNSTTNKLSYASGSSNKVAQIATGGAYGMICPAFEIREDKYQFKLRIGTSASNMNFGTSATSDLQLIAIYTTTDELDGEYIVSGTPNATFATADRHNSSVTLQRLTPNTTNAVATGGSYSLRTFSWDPPSNAKFASIIIHKYNTSGTAIVDWITGYADTRAVLAADFTKTTALSALGDTDFPTALRNSAVDATHVGLGNVTDKSAAQLATDSNFTGNFGSLTAVNSNVTDISNQGTNITNVNAGLRGAGKSRMGLLANGKLTATENVGTIASPHLRPAGVIVSRSTNVENLAYTNSNNNIVKFNAGGEMGMVFPAIEIEEEKYRWKIRLDASANYATNTTIYLHYTANDIGNDEYVLPNGVTHETADVYQTSGQVTTITLKSSYSQNTTATTYSGTFTIPASADGGQMSLEIKYNESSTQRLYVLFAMVKVDTKNAYTLAEGLGRSGTSTQTIQYTDIGGFPVGNRLLRSDIKNSWGRYTGGSSNKIMDETGIIITDADTMQIPTGLFVGGDGSGGGLLSVDDGCIKVRQNGTSGKQYMITRSGNLNSWLMGWFSSTFEYFNWSYYNGSSWVSKGYLKHNVDENNLDFTGQHRSHSDQELDKSHAGLIVISDGVYKNLSDENKISKPEINEALPVVSLSSSRNQKAVYGVISDKEADNEYDQDPDTGEQTRKVRTYSVGAFVSVFDKTDDERLIINSLGEGAIWICNINGNLENGDYITTCEVPGYGMLQDDDLLHNYTVAKITQDCTFELDNPNYDCVEFEHEGNTYRKAFVGCTYHCG